MAKILIVDDMHGIANLIQSILKSENHDVDVAYNGDQAIKKLEKDAFDMVLTDILMPEKDGFDVVNYINDNCKDRTKIVAMTGGGITISAPVALAALEEKVDATMRKPINKDELLQCVSSILG